MRYILVNERVPKTNRFCALCCGALTGHYLRELDTRIKYCGVGCYTEHCMSSLTACGGIHGEFAETMRLLPGASRSLGGSPLGTPLLLPPP